MAQALSRLRAAFSSFILPLGFLTLFLPLRFSLKKLPFSAIGVADVHVFDGPVQALSLKVARPDSPST